MFAYSFNVKCQVSIWTLDSFMNLGLRNYSINRRLKVHMRLHYKYCIIWFHNITLYLLIIYNKSFWCLIRCSAMFTCACIFLFYNVCLRLLLNSKHLSGLGLFFYVLLKKKFSTVPSSAKLCFNMVWYCHTFVTLLTRHYQWN